MDLRQIRTFCFVARSKSFSKAAKLLNIAQPAVSRQVRALEDEFQIQLLFRTTRGVELTEQGEVLLNLGTELLASAERLREALTEAANRVQGEVNIGILPSVMAFFTTPLLEECRRTFPDVTIHVAEGVDSLLREWLTAGKIDLAIMTDRGVDPAFVQRPLAEEELLLVSDPTQVAPSERSIALADLPRIPIIIGSGFKQRIDPILKARGIELRYEMIGDNIKMIRELLRRSECHTILTREVVRREVEDGTLQVRRIKDPALKRQIILATNPRHPVTLSMKAVAQLVQDHARNLH